MKSIVLNSNNRVKKFEAEVVVPTGDSYDDTTFKASFTVKGELRLTEKAELDWTFTVYTNGDEITGLINDLAKERINMKLTEMLLDSKL